MKGCRPLNDQEVKLVTMSFGGKYATRDKALFLLGLKSGFRISELLSLRLSDVLRAGRMADCVSVQRRHMKKKTESRTVLLRPEAKETLDKWINELKANGHIAADTLCREFHKPEDFF
ncbi:MAG: site-specific integrase [Thermodesulfobacteriota bacterium]